MSARPGSPRSHGSPRAPRPSRGCLTWITLAPALALLAACGADGGPLPDDGEATGTASSPIYGGTLDTGAGENAAVVALRLPGGGLCTGALVARNLVLTARHCVSENVSEGVACDEKGQSLNGAHLGADLSASAIGVFTGASPDVQNGTPVARGRQIFHVGGTSLCNADIALLALDRAIAGVSPLKIRLAQATTNQDTLRAVGYGKNDTGQPVGTRLRRSGVAVRAVGARVSLSGTPLAARELEVGQSICNGDSGGPGISERTGAIVGVVSRGGDCAANFGQVYTTARGFDELMARAFAAAGATIAEETGAAVSDAGADDDADDAGTTAARRTDTTGALGDAGATRPARSRARDDLGAGASGGCSAGGGRGAVVGAGAAVMAGALALLIALRAPRRAPARARRVPRPRER